MSSHLLQRPGCPSGTTHSLSVVLYHGLYLSLLALSAYLSLFQVGLSDDTSLTPVKLFCPKCRDIYNCPNHRRTLPRDDMMVCFRCSYYLTCVVHPLCLYRCGWCLLWHDVCPHVLIDVRELGTDRTDASLRSPGLWLQDSFVKCVYPLG